jgi:uncharacterized protein YndB with AHSA1/START domain
MEETTIEVQIQIAARRETVYRFLSDASRFRQWIGDADVTPAVGGELAVRYPNGNVARGRFLELVPNQRVVFTWGYDGSANGMAPGSSTVTVELSEVESGTLVTLRHRGVPNQEARHGHLQGWKHYVSRLADVAVALQTEGRLKPLLDTYLKAFNEADDVQRLALLGQCWDSGAAFCDPMGRASTREEFSRFIGSAHRMAPDMKLELVGSPQQTHEFVRFDWRLLVGGNPYSSGTSFGRLDLDGCFQSLVGFWNQ